MGLPSNYILSSASTALFFNDNVNKYPISEEKLVHKHRFFLIAIVAIGLTACLQGNALASGDPPKKEDKPIPVKKVEPPGLTGNKLPKCAEGEYIAAMMCKKAAPGYYLEHGMKYPAACPKATTSPAGAKSINYCK